ncbi:MAG TPA: hypothetical protein VKP52_11510 [Pseudolabrys sp.]|jgi:hypothetical protein|nr:hypothetical protein [Pseudolabrys sp.]
MRVALIAGCLAGVAGFALAPAWADDKPADKSDYSTGRTQTPETVGQKQPQGWTGPINTESGGAPAESPQGQSPPGMQPAPEGSSKTMVAPDKDK